MACAQGGVEESGEVRLISHWAGLTNTVFLIQAVDDEIHDCHVGHLDSGHEIKVGDQHNQ